MVFFITKYYDVHVFPNIQIINGNIDIEQALKNIPTCTVDDRTRQRALLYTLQQWSYFAQQYHIQYWITRGALVGYVQRRGLIPFDLNIDILIMAQHTAQLDQLSKLNFSSVYQLKVHPQWFLAESEKRSYFESEDINFLAPNARFINRNDDVYINIWPIYDHHPAQKRIAKHNEPILTQYETNDQWKSLPRTWIFPLYRCFFSGIMVWCPKEAENFVIHMYSDIAANLSSIQCINSSWKQSDHHELLNERTTTNNEENSSEQEITT